MIFTARKNLKLEVSRRQLEILIGCLLGDAYLTKLGKIQIEQANKDYTYWKFQELRTISYTNPPKEVIRYDKKDNRVTKSYRFWTRQYFRDWRNYWYKDSHKRFPVELVKWITPLSIAVWYMDDGSYDKKSKCIFSTESFDEESRLEIIRLFQKFGIEVKAENDGMSKIRLRLRNQSIKEFFELVRSYIHQSMMYKVP